MSGIWITMGSISASRIRLIEGTIILSQLILSSAVLIHEYENLQEEWLISRNVMNLIYLEDYKRKAAVESLQTIDNESQRMPFLVSAIWEDEGYDNAKKMLAQLQRHWMLALTLANGDKNDISAIIVTLYIKIVAFFQGTSYVICVLFYKQHPTSYESEHCKTLARYLLTFSNLGTKELVKKFLSLIDSSLKKMERKSLQDFIHIPERTIVHIFDSFKQNPQLPNVGRGNAPRFSPSESEEMFNAACEEILKVQLFLYGLQYLLFNMEFISNNPIGVIIDGIYSNKKFVIPLWNQVQYNSERLDNIVEGMQCDIISIIREYAIKKAELRGLCRKKLVEEFERVLPNQLYVSIEDYQFVNNVNLKME